MKRRENASTCRKGGICDRSGSFPSEIAMAEFPAAATIRVAFPLFLSANQALLIVETKALKNLYLDSPSERSITP
jgi:hypothetical protein